MELVDLVREIRRLRRDLDEFDVRITRLERGDTLLFSLPEQRRQRRAAVLQARRQGLSVALISRTLGLSRHTVDGILAQVEHEPPARVLGADGRWVSAHRNGDRTSA